MPMPLERRRVLERQLDAFAQLLGRLVEPADVGPADRRRLDHDLAHRARLDALHRGAEVVLLDLQVLEHFGRDRARVEVELGHDPPHRLDRRLARERGEVGADEAVRRARELVEVDALAERHAAGVDAEDLAPALLVGHADDDLAVEPAGPAQRLVDRVGAVGRGDHHEVGARLQPSISVSSWATRRFSASPVTFCRLGAIESISSMNTIAGAERSASSNTSRSRRSLSP
jgi:hypothetical protein